MPIFLLLHICIIFLAHSTVYAVTPYIQANNSNTAINVASDNTVTVTIGLDANGNNNEADWWIIAVTPFNSPSAYYFYHGQTSSWQAGVQVSYQKPIENLSHSVILNNTVLPEGQYVFYFALDLNPNGKIDMDSIISDSIEVNIVFSNSDDSNNETNDQDNANNNDTINDFYNVTSCGSNNHIFTVAPLDSSAYFEIDPLGATNPSAHTFPTMHTYMMLTDKTQPRAVYSPGDITITQINSVENLTNGSNDYSINFSPCTEVTGYYDHISMLTENLLAQINNYDNCHNYFAGTEEYRYCIKWLSFDISAGTLIGYAGGNESGSAALDFGLRDTRVTAITYANPDRFTDYDDNFYVVCPYDYYQEGEVKDILTEKLQAARTDLPVCGTVALDVVDTAQGRWYLPGEFDGNENNHIALAPSNKAPDSIGVLSIGNPSIGMDAYYFDYTVSGQINRSFDEVIADGKIYCWDTLRDREDAIGVNGNPLSGYLFLQMTDNNHLILERNESANSCPNNPDVLNFSVAAIQFER